MSSSSTPTTSSRPRSLYDNAEAYEAIAEFERAAELYERYFAACAPPRTAAARRRPRRSRRPRARGRRGRWSRRRPPPAAGRYEEKKATDGIINAAVFRAGLREWTQRRGGELAYLDVPQRARRAAHVPLTRRPLRSSGQRREGAEAARGLPAAVREGPRRVAPVSRPRSRSSSSAPATPRGARRAHGAGARVLEAQQGRVKERGLALVAQAILRRPRASVRRVRPDHAQRRAQVPEGPAQVKGKQLKQLEESYGQVVKLKQAEPAVCALYKIGLAYKRFAQTLYDAPIPKEIRGDRELVEEYKSQLAQQAEPLEAKAIEGLALAVNTSRDYGVVNDCARQATAILVKHKPEEYGPSPEALPAIDAPSSRDAPRGYGILAEVQRRAGARRLDAPGRPAAPAAPRPHRGRPRGARPRRVSRHGGPAATASIRDEPRTGRRRAEEEGRRRQRRRGPPAVTTRDDDHHRAPRRRARLRWRARSAPRRAARRRTRGEGAGEGRCRGQGAAPEGRAEGRAPGPPRRRGGRVRDPPEGAAALRGGGARAGGPAEARRSPPTGRTSSGSGARCSTRPTSPRGITTSASRSRSRASSPRRAPRTSGARGLKPRCARRR